MNDDQTRDALARATRNDPALVDIMALCEYLPAANAAELRTAVEGAVSNKPEQGAFGGISVYCHPARQQDVEESFISPAIARAPEIYETLALSKQKKHWSSIALGLLDRSNQKKGRISLVDWLERRGRGQQMDVCQLRIGTQFRQGDVAR